MDDTRQIPGQQEGGVQLPTSATRGALLDLAAFLSSIFVYSLLLDIKMDVTDISLVNTKLV